MAGRNAAPESLRVTPGGVRYRLTRKRVKNYNLHLAPDGTPAVSAPAGVPAEVLDAFVDGHSRWLAQASARRSVQLRREAVPLPDAAAALAAFTEMSDAVYPAFAQALHGRRPAIRVRDMSSRWGVCNIAKGQITFALRLYQQPAAAQIYVVVHEYCHFLVPNHSPAFWREVERLLPDWKARRKLLRL
jgi:predicted metal-dependent hydrolase